MNKPTLVKTNLDKQIVELAAKVDHRTMAIWACDCAERVLVYFEESYADDNRPRNAIKAGREWVNTGVFRMADVRKASLDSHAAARNAEEYSSVRSAARAAGQAAAAAHVAGHAVAAAIYAATAVRDLPESIDTSTAVLKEREWQYQHLLDLIKNKRLA